MTQSPATFKSFEPRPGHTPCRLPMLIEGLVGGAALPGYFGLDDLREMSKFLEIPNVHGVAAYPIERAAPAGGIHAEAGALARRPELPAGVERPLADRLETEPLVMAQGMVRAAGGNEGLLVHAIAPQTHAHLIAALKMMLHPWPENGGNGEEGEDGEDGKEVFAADYTLLIWPMPLVSRRGRAVVEELIGQWPEEGNGGQGTGLIVGCDDPGLIATMIEDAALRKTGKEGKLDWRSPLQRAGELAATPAGRARALDVESWLFGVESDGDGHFPLLEGNAEKRAGWMVNG